MSVRQRYDEWAAQYDGNDNPTRDLNAQSLRMAKLPLARARVLEAGCGTGLNTAFLAGSAARVTAMDFSGGMLARARTRVDADNVEFVTADISRRWPAADAGHDLVVINLVLEHIDALEPVFSEARRVLVDGGMLFVSELHPYRQLTGGQARFTLEDGEHVVYVPAWKHAVSDYLGAGLAAGFHLHRIAEPAVDGDEMPRLLQLWMLAGTAKAGA